MNDTKKLAELEANEDWNRAIELTKNLLKEEPNSHWLLTRLSSSYYESRKYKIALSYVQKVLKIAPHCPLVQWDYAGTLDMLGREKEAIVVWKRLLKRGADRIAYGECGEGIRWAESMLNDCRYKIGLCNADIGNVRAAKRYFKMHLKNRRPRLPSLYPRRKVESEMRKLS